MMALSVELKISNDSKRLTEDATLNVILNEDSEC